MDCRLHLSPEMRIVRRYRGGKRISPGAGIIGEKAFEIY
jgi:hypothetical protein